MVKVDELAKNAPDPVSVTLFALDGASTVTLNGPIVGTITTLSVDPGIPPGVFGTEVHVMGFVQFPPEMVEVYVTVEKPESGRRNEKHRKIAVRIDFVGLFMVILSIE